MSRWHATLTHVRGNQLFIERVSVWVVYVVVDTCLVVEPGWLPELLHVVSCVIVVEQVLGHETYQEETQIVGFKSSVERLEI